MAEIATQRPSRTVTSSDGVELAVYEQGLPTGPAVILIHGYPDDHTVWDGVVAILRDDFRVITYDMRGAGRSGRPKTTSAYRITRLVDDLVAIVYAVARSGAHLLAHDWGSIHAWDALADPRLAERVRTFTSISGPSLDMMGTWMRDIRHQPRAVLSQLARSSYAMGFQVPAVPEFAVRRGVVDRVVAASSSRGEPSGTVPHAPSSVADAIDGISLYRANLGRLLRPRPRSIAVPTQVLAPVNDVNVTVACQTTAPQPFVPGLRVHLIEGNHWAPAQHPQSIAEHFLAFAREHDTRPA
ncbi:alpha/beta fold hydrolase [Nocardia otitidiscaviarum]|uniref:alpha/beta fold hydrolase n=1 Tax=Nocardia otitidiscaviarum TaxID=1823 RepID=UPI0004A76ACF|nr:alpha/beta fold hydrolase [Nocardia otitidiscaviarum]MBF6135027.1 alpha/beta fold hydrolase [Nocardia otitidiscaviarum]MBF6486850.1 alpha/beta fold hydrolase [Nocardia otitidiscaviarum]